MGVVDKKTIDDFYKNKKIAVIGASRNKTKYGGMLLKELLSKNYEAIPVNPNADSIQGHTCYKNIKDVPEDVEVAIAVVPPSQQEIIAIDASEAGIKTLWLHEHVMKGISNTRAVYQCEEKGVNCIVGYCPMMFLPGAGFPHNIHKGIMGLFGALPK